MQCKLHLMCHCKLCCKQFLSYVAFLALKLKLNNLCSASIESFFCQELSMMSKRQNTFSNWPLAWLKGSLPTLKSMIIFISLVRIYVLFLISQGFRPACRCRFLPHLPTAKKIVLAISATPIISTLALSWTVFLPWPVSFPLILPGLCKFGGGKCISQVIHASFFYGYGTGPAQQGKKYFFYVTCGPTQNRVLTHTHYTS